MVGIALGAAFATQAGAFGGESSLWSILTIAGAALATVAGFVAWRKPQAGAGAGAMALCGGFVGGLAVRVAMWLVGTPLMNLFLMPLD